VSGPNGRNPSRPGKTPGPLRFAGDPETPGGWRGYLPDFIAWAEAMHYSPHTIKNRRIDVGYFIDWCEERAVMTPQAVTRAMPATRLPLPAQDRRPAAVVPVPGQAADCRARSSSGSRASIT
jgi:hypothetical protein